MSTTVAISRSDWQDWREAIEAAVEPYIRINADGEQYIPHHPSLTTLSEEYAECITVGLEFGWLATDEGEA